MNISLGNSLIVLAACLWAVELIPQIIKTIKTKKVEDISLIFFATCLIAYGCYAVGNFLEQNWVIFISHIPSLLLNMVMVYLIIKYKKVGV